MPLKMLKKSSTAKLEVQIEYEKMKCNELQNVLGTYKTLMETLSRDISSLFNTIEEKEKESNRLDHEIGTIEGVLKDSDKTKNLSKAELNTLETVISLLEAFQELYFPK